MQLPRACGLLCHITSLPAAYGVGDLGPAAYNFVDFLVRSGQRIWQTLPLGPPASENSPYSAYSAFAGNPLLISPDFLLHSAWISEQDLKPLRESVRDPQRVDFGQVSQHKQRLLEVSWQGFQRQLGGLISDQMVQFCRRHSYWLDDFARFEALLRHFGHSDWTRWPADLARREPAALAYWDHQVAEAIEYVKFQQFVFDQQWSALKAYANQRQVQIYGDMPIFVAQQSADVWSHRELFLLNDSGQPTVVAGVPPDYFSETGQRWGNPLYDWDANRGSGYRWWVDRIRHSLEIFDLLRIDHFRGFEAYWEIPADAETAVTGQWRLGPGAELFDVLNAKLGKLPLIAEDLGLITPEVHQLRDQIDLPGMRVLQFGFASSEDDFHRPNQYPSHCVAYTGTHDNDTLMGWYQSYMASPDQPDVIGPYLQQFLEQYPDLSGRPIHWQMIASVMHAAANTAVIPVQDLLGLDSGARMNVPGQARGNWDWRLLDQQLDDEVSQQLFAMTVESGRA